MKKKKKKKGTNTLVNLLRFLKHSINQDQVEETGQKGSKLHVDVVVGVKKVVAVKSR